MYVVVAEKDGQLEVFLCDDFKFGPDLGEAEQAAKTTAALEAEGFTCRTVQAQHR